MKPDWQTEDGRIRLYCGDCLDVLPRLERGTVQCVLTDPPYSSGGLHKAARTRPINEKYAQSVAGIEYREFSGDCKDQRSWMAWCAYWMRDCQRLLVDNGYLMTFCDWRQLPAITDVMQWADVTWCGIVPWDKGDGSRAGNTSMFRHQCEYIAWGCKGGTGGYSDRGGPWPGVVRCNAVPPTQRDHQSEKPRAVLLSLLACCNPGEIVLDCFMGSGTTGEAAIAKGLGFIGIELDRCSFEIAVERIQAELSRYSLFEPTRKAVQRTLTD